MMLLIQYTIIFSSVLILVALGGCFSEHSGVINLGLEGIMVIGALGGALTMRYLTGTSGSGQYSFQCRSNHCGYSSEHAGIGGGYSYC